LKAIWRPYGKHKRARPHYYSDQELEDIILACDQVEMGRRGYRTPLWWNVFITLLHDTAVRLSEAGHLIWREVNFEGGVIRIQPHERLQGVLPWKSKASGSHRTIPMTPRLIGLLADLQARQPEGVPYVFLPKARYLELQRKGIAKCGEILCGIRKGFVKIRRRAGIDEGTIHDMRRTCITNWARHPEMKPKDVQLLAGHEDIQTTLDIYTMIEEGDVVEKAKRILQGHAGQGNRDQPTVGTDDRTG